MQVYVISQTQRNTSCTLTFPKLEQVQQYACLIMCEDKYVWCTNQNLYFVPSMFQLFVSRALGPEEAQLSWFP